MSLFQKGLVNRIKLIFKGKGGDPIPNVTVKSGHHPGGQGNITQDMADKLGTFSSKAKPK